MDSWINRKKEREMCVCVRSRVCLCVCEKRDRYPQHLFDINEMSIQPLNDQLAQFRPSYFSVNERRSVLLSLATYGAITSPSTR